MGLPVFLWNTGVSALVYFLCKETIGDIELKPKRKWAAGGGSGLVTAQLARRILP